MSKKHIHKYKKIKQGERVIWKCMLACHHYVEDATVIGRECICWKCGKPFIFQNSHRYLTRPNCYCERKRNEATSLVDEVIKDDGSFDVNELLKKLGGG